MQEGKRINEEKQEDRNALLKNQAIIKRERKIKTKKRRK